METHTWDTMTLTKWSEQSTDRRNGKKMKIYNAWCITVTFIQKKREDMREKKCTIVFRHDFFKKNLQNDVISYNLQAIYIREICQILWRDQANNQRRQKIKYPVWLKANQRKCESQLLWDAGQPIWHTHANIPWKYTQHGQFSSLGWHLDSVHSLRRWYISVELWRLCLFVFLIVADCLLFCVPNSFDILSWLPEVPWVGKATIPFGQLFQ